MASNIKSKEHDLLQGITLAKIGTKREKLGTAGEVTSLTKCDNLAIRFSLAFHESRRENSRTCTLLIPAMPQTGGSLAVRVRQYALLFESISSLCTRCHHDLW